MTYTKLDKNNSDDGAEKVSGLISYCRNCGWEGPLENIDNSVYKRNYEEDFIANKIITNKYTIFDVTLPRVEYNCTNNNCVTNLDIDDELSFIVSNIPADINDTDFENTFKEHVISGDIVNAYRVRLTTGVILCKDKATCDILMKKFNNKEYDSDTTLKTSDYTKPSKEVLYLKYDSINMRYLYICANCGTSWKKN
tara:strand:- start:243 stop:830 length:588 start_codon:yes stop_codon:yes gene_type:complete